jgi:sulfoxide reductase heme-binding subunit YedZ
VFGLALLPALYLAWAGWAHTLGANPIEAITRYLGDWALRFLLITLSISTLRRLLHWAQLLKLRRMLGLFAFFYASVHVLSYISLEQFFDWTEIGLDILERPFITAGVLAFLGMIPLALTSTKAAMRRLGKQWQRLHYLIYPLTGLALLHFWWLADSKARNTEPLIYSLVFALLLAERSWVWITRAKSASKSKVSLTRT